MQLQHNAQWSMLTECTHMPMGSWVLEGTTGETHESCTFSYLELDSEGFVTFVVSWYVDHRPRSTFIRSCTFIRSN